VAPQAGFEPAT